MPRRSTHFSNDSIHHVFNRGVHKKEIFHSENDYIRFLDVASYYLNYEYPYSAYSQQLKQAQRHHRTVEFKQEFDLMNKLPLSPVSILAYCIMPNHFHLILKQNTQNGICQFMQKIGSSYSHYYNRKYNEVGTLFQGRFKNVLIENSQHLVHLSKYVHLNPLAAGLVETTGLERYPWSSYPDYIQKSTRSIVSKRLILKQFNNNVADYRDYISQTISEEYQYPIKGLTLDDDFNWY